MFLFSWNVGHLQRIKTKYSIIVGLIPCTKNKWDIQREEKIEYHIFLIIKR